MAVISFECGESFQNVDLSLQLSPIIAKYETVYMYSVIIIMLNIFSTKLTTYTSLRNQAAGQN